MYVVLVPCFWSSTFLYVHGRNMLPSLVLNYGSTSTTLPCLTQYSRVKLAISRSLSTSSPRALLRPSSNIERDDVQENEDFFGTNGTPDLNLILHVINYKPIDIGSRAKVLDVNISSDLKRNLYIVEVVQKAGKSTCLLSQLNRAVLGPNELVQFYRTCIEPIPEYACPVFRDGLPVYLSRELETVQKTAMGITFPCFLYEEGLVKTSLVTLSDQRQARLMDKLFKKILGNKDCKVGNSIVPQNAKPN